MEQLVTAQPAANRGYDDQVMAALTARPGGLTAEAAASRARNNNPSLQARQLDVALSKANLHQVLMGYLPQIVPAAVVTRTSSNDFAFGSGVTVGAINSGPLSVGTCPGGVGDCVLDAGGQPVAAVASDVAPTPRNNYKLELNVAVPISDYVLGLSAARNAAKNDIAARQHSADAETRRIELEAKVAYYQWVRVIAQVAVAERALASNKARLRDARRGFRGGALAAVDVKQIQSLVASANVAVQQAKSFELLARQNLAIMMGESSADYQLGENIFADLEPLSRYGSLADLIAHGQKHRSEIRSLIATSSAAKAAHKGAGTQLWPRIDGVANVTHANPNQLFFPLEDAWNTSWYVGVSVSWSLDRFFQARAQRAIIDTSRRIADTHRQVLERGIAMEVSAAWNAWQRAATSLEESRAALAAAEAVYDQRVALFRGGEATTSEIIEAEVQWHNATMLLVNARIDSRIARARLLSATAWPTENKQ